MAAADVIDAIDWFHIRLSWVGESCLAYTSRPERTQPITGSALDVATAVRYLIENLGVVGSEECKKPPPRGSPV